MEIQKGQAIFSQNGRAINGSGDSSGTSDTDDEVLAKVRNLIKNGDQTKVAVAKEADIPISTFTEVLNGTYKGDPTPRLAKMRSLLALQAEKAELATRLPKAPGWTLTDTADKIWAGLKFAQLRGKISCIYGGPGLGKSMTARAYLKQHNNVYIATMTPVTAYPPGALTRIAASIETRGSNRGAFATYQAVCERMMPGSLLIIDEAQQLSRKAIETVRAIHDESLCGLALLGNSALYSGIYGAKSADMAQIYSRIAHRVPLSKPTSGDVKALAGSWGLPPNPDIIEYLEQIAGLHGALRDVGSAIEWALLHTKRPAIEIERQDLANAGQALNLVRMQ